MRQSYLLTGGSGRLGGALRGLLPGLQAPTRAELDITEISSWNQALEHYQPSCIIHAAAYTDVKMAENERDLCRETNLEAVKLLVNIAGSDGVKVVFISTDYVFDGLRGDYREDDKTGPTLNYYAETKRLAELEIEKLPDHLIIRTSFRESPWPYEKAFEDLYTSQDYLENIAPEIALCLRSLPVITHKKLHIATERKSLYELAKQTRPLVNRASRADAGVRLPFDVSLNVDRWKRLKAQV